jgi:hypothetical protein
VRYLLQDRLVRREAVVARWEQDLEEDTKAVGPHTPAADRLEETRQFLAFTREQLARVLNDWRRRRSAP